MPANRTPKPAKIAQLAALALRLEVNILKDGRSYTSIIDMTKGQGVPIEAVPEHLSGEAGEAILRALVLTPGVLPPEINDGKPPTLAVLAKGDSETGTIITIGSKTATHADMLEASSRMIDALTNIRMHHAMALSKDNANANDRKSLN